MNIIAISGSPRKGNAEWMVNTVLDAAAGTGAETRLILLRTADIRQCRGCLACERRDGQGIGACVIDDDMSALLPEMLAADAIVMGTPCYMGLLSGLLKTFLDRTCPVWPALKGKGLAGVAVAEESIGAAMKNLRTYGDLLGMRWFGGVSVLAKLPNEASLRPGLARRLQSLGLKVTGAQDA
jgi:multimeric flavodoxin WrbA